MISPGPSTSTGCLDLLYDDAFSTVGHFTTPTPPGIPSFRTQEWRRLGVKVSLWRIADFDGPLNNSSPGSFTSRDFMSCVVLFLVRPLTIILFVRLPVEWIFDSYCEPKVYKRFSTSTKFIPETQSKDLVSSITIIGVIMIIINWRWDVNPRDITQQVRFVLQHRLLPWH